MLRLPPLIRRTAAAGAPPRTLNAPFDARVDALSDPESLFGKLRMPAPKRSTDDMGRDLWTRTWYGARVSLLIAFVTVPSTSPTRAS